MKDACEPMFLNWFIALGPFSAAGCQKAVVAPLADYRRRVPELGPCFGNDHPNCGSMEARFIGILRMLSRSASSGEFCWHSHWKNESRAHSLPNNCPNICIPLKTAAFRRSLMDGRQPLPNLVTSELPVIQARSLALGLHGALWCHRNQ
jgi:hypothetical protein